MRALFLTLVLLCYPLAVLAEDSWVSIISRSEFMASDGTKVTCLGLAKFLERNSPDIQAVRNTYVDRVTEEEVKRNFDPEQKWTPEYVHFLKDTARKCIAERKSGMGMIKSLLSQTSNPSQIVHNMPLSPDPVLDRVYSAVISVREQERIETAERQARQEAYETQQRAKQQAMEATLKAIEARGYKYISNGDFELDSRSMPEGKKLLVTGFYLSEGRMEFIQDIPGGGYGPRVPLITENAQRAARKMFQQCRIGACRISLLGYTGRCETTMLGRTVSRQTCLIVEELVGGE